ncbi:hypothetical protein V1283_003452 [Bradyrhizobium sp. AZCC 2262]|uniref:hypothetical protein n=1 Tax=Bradyrhizobium sp. AZCC 2262 TaxID=3117022 RepID=UPI002FF08C53
MASNSSDPRHPQNRDAGTRTRSPSETNGSSVVLHRAISGNDNVADSHRPTNVDQQETSEWLPAREENPISSADVARGKAIIIVYFLSAILVMLAWFYLLSLPAMRITEWL